MGEQHLAGCGAVGLGLRGIESVLQPDQFGLGDRDDDLFLGLELMVDSGFGDAHGVGDHLADAGGDQHLLEATAGADDDEDAGDHL